MLAPLPPPHWVLALTSEALAAARNAWPGVVVHEDAFAQHVASKLSGTEASRAALRVPDLLLAFAAAQRDPAAMAHLESAHFDEVRGVIRQFPSLPIAPDDVLQRLRQKLFLDDPPALLAYGGRGELRSWLRAATIHLLLNVSTRESKERPAEAELFEAVLEPEASAEAAYLKQACRVEFEEAFVAALGRLPARETSLLKYAFSDGLNVDQIAAIYGVHRATAARWVAAARELLVAETRADLMTRLRIDETEAASLVRVALSKVGTTLLRGLR